MNVCTKMSYMDASFELMFEAALAKMGLNLYKIALSIGDDPSRLDKIVYMRRPASFETRLQALRAISESHLLKGRLDYATMAAWLINDYVPKDILKRAFEEKVELDPDLLQAVTEYREQTKKTRRKLKPVFQQKTLWPQADS